MFGNTLKIAGSVGTVIIIPVSLSRRRFVKYIISIIYKEVEMNSMRKLVFLLVILGVVALSVGCQQSGLSEQEDKDIVEEEVARQLADMDDLTVSRLWIANSRGDIVGMLGVIDGEVALTIDNADGTPVVGLGCVDGEEGSLILQNADGEYVVIMGSADGNGDLTIRDKHGQVTFVAP